MKPVKIDSSMWDEVSKTFLFNDRRRPGIYPKIYCRSYSKPDDSIFPSLLRATSIRVTADLHSLLCISGPLFSESGELLSDWWEVYFFAGGNFAEMLIEIDGKFSDDPTLDGLIRERMEKEYVHTRTLEDRR